MKCCISFDYLSSDIFQIRLARVFDPSPFHHLRLILFFIFLWSRMDINVVPIALNSSGFICSRTFVGPLRLAFRPPLRRASWIVDPSLDDSHREENKRSTSFVILRRGFYWRG